MAFVQRVHLSTGDLVATSFSALAGQWRLVIVYMLALASLGMLAGSISPEPLQSILSLATLGAFMGGQYLIFEAMLRRAGEIRPDKSRRFFRFVGLGVVVLLGVWFAASLFLIPGIIVAARWIIAPSLLVAARDQTFTSLSESWSLTRGNTLPIALAMILLILMAMAITVAISAVANALGGLHIIDLLLANGTSLLLVGLSVAVYGRLNDEAHTLSEVFA